MIFFAQRERAFLNSVTLVCLLGLVVPAWGTSDPNVAGAAQLIRAQLPRDANFFQADAETMAGAVSRAIIDHRPQAPAILSAALTSGVSEKNAKDKPAVGRSCNFVTRVFKASLLAAPDQASALTDTAAALFPDCADQLAAVIRAPDQHLAAYDYKDRSDYKDQGDFKDGANYKDRASAPVAGISNLGTEGDDLSFGVGFGPGFPGSPGFVGSPPSGGFALPPVALPTPVTAPVTSVVNQ